MESTQAVKSETQAVKSEATKAKFYKPVKRIAAFSNPFLEREVILHTTPAQMVFDAAFDECAISMRNLSSVLPTLIKSGSEMLAVNGAVDHQLNVTMADIRKEEARIQKIAENNGIQIDKLNYTNVVKHQARLTCGKAGQYLQLIVEMDKMLCTVHSAWFAGFIPDDAKASLERQWRRKVISVAAEIGNITNRAFRAAEKSKSDTTAEVDADSAIAVAPKKTTKAKPKTKTDTAVSEKTPPVVPTEAAADAAIA